MLNHEIVQKQFWINCWLQSRLTHKHGWRLMVDGYRLNSCSHREQGLWEEPFCVTYQSSELYIIALLEADLVLSNELFIITLLAWVMARRTRMIGWRCRFEDGGFKHTAQKLEHTTKGSVLDVSSGGWSLKRLFLYGSAALHNLASALALRASRRREGRGPWCSG